MIYFGLSQQNISSLVTGVMCDKLKNAPPHTAYLALSQA